MTSTAPAQVPSTPQPPPQSQPSPQTQRTINTTTDTDTNTNHQTQQNALPLLSPSHPPTHAATAPSPTPSPPASPPPTLESAGVRATALQKIFSEALSHSLRTCTYANFASCFPTPARHEPDALRDLWRMFGRELEERCRTAFDAILSSRDVTPSLNELDRLVADARKRKGSGGGTGTGTRSKKAQSNATPIPPHTLPPTTLYLAHLRPFLHAQHTALRTRHASLRASNEALAARIREQREEVEDLVKRLESVLGDLDGAAVSIARQGERGGGEGMEGVDEGRDVDGDEDMDIEGAGGNHSVDNRRRRSTSRRRSRGKAKVGLDAGAGVERGDVRDLERW